MRLRKRTTYSRRPLFYRLWNSRLRLWLNSLPTHFTYLVAAQRNQKEIARRKSPTGQKRRFNCALNRYFGVSDFRDIRLGGVFGRLIGRYHLTDSRAAVGRKERRGKAFASRMSCPTLRIFSSNDSRASFCRISGFIVLAVLPYAVAGYFPALFCRGWPAGAIVQYAPCPFAAPRWRRSPRCVRR